MNWARKISLLLVGICLAFSSCAQKPVRETPVAVWENVYFRGIDPAARLSGLQKLSEVSLRPDDQEIRIWSSVGLESLEGVVLKQISTKWSATHIVANHHAEITKTEVRELGPPKSGWDALWKKLNEQELLTLPDPTGEECMAGIDGSSYVVEINTTHKYRTYMYGRNNSKCPNIQKIKAIGRIIAEEFYDGVGECTRAEWLPCGAKFGT